MNGAMLQAFGALALVIALMFVSAWLFRRGGGLQALTNISAMTSASAPKACSMAPFIG